MLDLINVFLVKWLENMNRFNNICYVADKADWLGARLPGTDRPLVAISRHSSGTPLQFFVKISGRKLS